MSAVDDIVAGGVMPLRHHDANVELGMRVVKYACRVGGTDVGFGPGFDDVGQLQDENTGNGGTENTVGDLQCASLWPYDPAVGGTSPDATKRTTPSWAFAWPGIVKHDATNVDATNGATGVPMAVVQLVRTRTWTGDDRYLAKQMLLPPGIGPISDGAFGITIAGTDENAQHDVFFPMAGPQLAFQIDSGSNPYTAHQIDPATGSAPANGITTAALYEMNGSTVIKAGTNVYAQKEKDRYYFVLPMKACT